MKLELLIGDAKGTEENALAEAFRHIQGGSVALIGAETSGQTIAVSRWLSLPLIDRVLIGHSATSPELSDNRFSKFLRTCASDNIRAEAMAKLMKGLLFD